MRGVDRCDQGMNDYNISQKGFRWYLRVFYYITNAAVFNMRKDTECVVKRAMHDLEWDLDKLDNKDPWDKYVSKSLRWFKWTCDMGLRLIEMGIEMDWPDVTDQSQRPQWMRQLPFKLCDCRIFFFCKNNLTGKYGPPETAPPSPATHRQKRCRIVKVACEHAEETRVRLFPNSRDCGVCIEEGRRRKPAGVERNSSHIIKCALGCPHVECRKHTVCGEHWEEFQHKWK